MAICAFKQGKDEYFCSRVVAGSDFSVRYSFVSEGGLPTSFKPMDGQLLEEIDALRCAGLDVGE